MDESCLLCGRMGMVSPRAKPTMWKSKLTELFDSLPRHKKKFKVKYVIPLSYLWIGDYVDSAGTDSSAGGKSIVLFWPMKNFVATFR